jgi:hypothetical protein
MAGVRDQRPLPRERAMQPAQQLVHRHGERGDLIARPRDLDARRLITFGERSDLAPQPLDRRQRCAGQPVGAEACRRHEDRARDEQPAGDIAQRAVVRLERDARDRDPAGMVSQRRRNQALALVLVALGHHEPAVPGLP